MPGGKYTYRVRAYNDAGDSAYSNSAEFSVPTSSAPTISAIANQTLTVNGVTGPIPFTISDSETPAGSLTLSATSSNTALVPNSNLVFGGTGGNRTIAVTPNGGATGTTTITVKVSDGALTATRTFTVTVNTVTQPDSRYPSISAIPDITLLVNTSIELPFNVTAADGNDGSLRMSKDSSNPALIPTSNIVFGGSGSDRLVTITPVKGMTGTTTITATVRDGDLRTPHTFTVTVTQATNTAPTISAIADKTLSVNGVTGPIPFTVGDAETSAGSLTLSATSSNTALVPNSNLVLGGTGANRTIAVTPNGGATGTTTITVKVSDGKASATRSFDVTVNPPEKPSEPAPSLAPTISAIPDMTILVNKSVEVPFTVDTPSGDAGSLRMSKTSSNTSLIPTSNIVFGGSGGDRLVTITPVAGKTGTATLTFTVRDTNDRRTPHSFTVTVSQASNTAPTISSIANQTVDYGKSGSALSFTIGDAETAAGNLTLSAASSNTTLVPTSNIKFGGSGASRTVTVTPASGKSGTANITVTVGDGKLSASRTFAFTVEAAAPANTPPTISAIPNVKILVSKSSSLIKFTVGDAESDPGSLRMSKSSSNTSLIPTSGIDFGGSGANRTLKITPRSGKTGKATITATVRDGELTTSRTFTVTVSKTLSSSMVEGDAPTSKLANASIRATSGSGNETLIAGFAVTGEDEKPVLVRALGPTLSALGVSGAMSDPSLTVIAGGEVAAANNDWADAANPSLVETFNRVGAFNLDPSSRDAVTIVNGRPGSYTAQVAAKDARGGVALIELYDAGDDSSRLTNLSGRGQVGRGDDVLILGFVIAGDEPRQVLIRGIGPSLAQHGVNGVLLDPQLALYQDGTLVDSNDNGANDADVVKTASQVGAFAVSDSLGRDAALLVTLPAGAYTAVLSGVADTTGVALLELYDVEAIRSAETPR